MTRAASSKAMSHKKGKRLVQKASCGHVVIPWEALGLDPAEVARWTPEETTSQLARVRQRLLDAAREIGLPVALATSHRY